MVEDPRANNPFFKFGKFVYNMVDGPVTFFRGDFSQIYYYLIKLFSRDVRLGRLGFPTLNPQYIVAFACRENCRTQPAALPILSSKVSASADHWWVWYWWSCLQIRSTTTVYSRQVRAAGFFMKNYFKLIIKMKWWYWFCAIILYLKNGGQPDSQHFEATLWTL